MPYAYSMDEFEIDLNEVEAEMSLDTDAWIEAMLS